MSRRRFMDAVMGKNEPGQPSFGTGTSIVCQELMDEVGVSFPEAHLDAEKMAALALAGHTVLGFDVVMPLFSVCHEAAAMGCNVNWGDRDCMPESGKPIFGEPDDITIPADLLVRPGCAVPLKAIAMLRKRLCDDAAVCGKVFGPWTQSYHYFGLENFLVMTIEDPDRVRTILDRLIPVT
ncbi:MAG: MtaA/CmuA family methyltransferase, partial [Lentisphaerae bacterium]|nr:MtaA/CmuA family methyltransferase [Lentisphaerota bacterium]